MLTKNAVGNLINRYKAVLDTCRLLNVLGTCALAATLAMPATAWARDITTTENISSDTTISEVINVTAPNGFYNAEGYDIIVTTGGAVTVTNGTRIGTGNVPTRTGLWAKNLTISGGTYESTAGTTVNAGGELKVENGSYTEDSDTTINGNLIVGDGGTYTAKGSFPTSISANGTLTIENGGTYTAQTSAEVNGTLEVQSGGLYDAHGKTVTVYSGGKVTATTVATNIGATAGDGYTGVYAGKLQVQSGGLYNASGKTITVASGGKVTATTVATNIGATAGDGDTGVYAGKLDVQSGGLYDAHGKTVTVSGGSVTVADQTMISNNAPNAGLWASSLEVSSGTYTAGNSTTVSSNGTLTISGGIYNVGSDDAAWVNTAVTNADLKASDYAILAIAQADRLRLGVDIKLNVASDVTTFGANFGDTSLLVINGSKFSGTNYALDTYNIGVTEDAKLLIASSAVDFVDGAATIKVADADTLTIADGAWGYGGEDTDITQPDIIDTDTIYTDSTLVGVTGVDFNKTGKTYTVTLGKVSAVTAYESMDGSLASSLDSYKSGTNTFLDKALDPQAADAATGAKSIEGAAKPAVASGLGAALGHVGTASVGNIEMRNGSATVFSENDTRFMLAMAGDGAILPVDKSQEGFGIWFMPMYKHSSADGFESGNYDYGYDTDIYGATLGADYTFASSLRLGLAFNVGTGDSESTGDFDTTKNDFDYFGLTAYGNMRFGKLALSADLGYTASSNDINQDNAFGRLTADADASLFSFGMKGEYKLGFDSFNLTPYAGVRVNYYNIDSFDTKHQGSTTASTAQSDYTLVEFPVGLTFDTTLQSGGWDITPSLGLGVKFAAGDLDMDQKVRYTGAQSAVLTSEVADAVTFQGALGLGMKKDVYSVDLGYTLDLSENVQSHGVQVNLRYEF